MLKFNLGISSPDSFIIFGAQLLNLNTKFHFLLIPVRFNNHGLYSFIMYSPSKKLHWCTLIINYNFSPQQNTFFVFHQAFLFVQNTPTQWRLVHNNGEGAQLKRKFEIYRYESPTYCIDWGSSGSLIHTRVTGILINFC